MSSAGPRRFPRPDPAVSMLDEEDDLEATPITVSVDRPPSAVVRDHASFVLLTGAQAGAIFPIYPSGTVLGRGNDCSVVIDEGSVSRWHARVRGTERDGFFLEDLDSANGTSVNGVPVKSTALSNGDRIQLGPNVALRFNLMDRFEAELQRRVYDSSVRDGLTGVFNRKHFGERLASELAFASRHRTLLSLVIVDLDHFKRVNDDFGHLAGDAVLVSAAERLAHALRTEDLLARYGGEEFAIIARGITAAQSVALAERMREKVAGTRTHFGPAEIAITASLGVATLACCTRGGGIEEIVAIADRRLYVAKDGGRNRVVGPD